MVFQNLHVLRHAPTLDLRVTHGGGMDIHDPAEGDAVYASLLSIRHDFYRKLVIVQ